MRHPIGTWTKFTPAMIWNKLTRQMLRGSSARRSLIELAGALLRISDEFWDRLCRKGRLHGHAVGEADEACNRCEIGDEVKFSFSKGVALTALAAPPRTSVSPSAVARTAASGRHCYSRQAGSQQAGQGGPTSIAP